VRFSVTSPLILRSVAKQRVSKDEARGADVMATWFETALRAYSP